MPNIRHELLIGAPAEKIYSAITNQEGLSAWWTPDTKAKSELNSVAVERHQSCFIIMDTNPGGKCARSLPRYSVSQ